MTSDMDEWKLNLQSKGKCCVCEGTLSTSGHTNIIPLDKIATWKYPVWGNSLYKIPADGASGIVCDTCIEAWQESGNKLEVKYAFEFNPDTSEIRYHLVEELEDKVCDYSNPPEEPIHFGGG